MCIVQVIEALSNALIADARVFHISDPKFVDMYNQQSEPDCMAFAIPLFTS